MPLSLQWRYAVAIFLSVGYSTCFWCHVMERESFTNPEIARELNEGFVSIKLDREERPDLDEIYMMATQLLTRSGGWPNSVFLTSDLKPFFAGTYFPPRDAMGRPGFPRVLAALREAWALRRAEVLHQADAIAEAMREHLEAAQGGPGPLPESALAGTAQTALAAGFDAAWGGFTRAPKFPSPSNLFFLLERADDAEAREMLVVTLDRMACGGIQDHLAGGFHRYSTDAAWLVPHFEKMLYDNAALAWVYAEADRLAPEHGFARVARATLDFVLAELAGAEGGFLSAIDAETDGHEGAYYTWTAEELKRALAPADHALLASVYGFGGPPNFEDDRYVLHLPEPLRERARALATPEEDLRRRLEPGRRALREARAKRPRPLVDDKVLTDWNGLMIAAMARAGELLGEPRYVEAARRAAEFALGKLRGPDGALLHSWRAGRGRIPAMLDDYAFFISGLLRLSAATGDARFLREALRLQAEQDRRLGDAEEGGYFAGGEDPRVLFRAKPAYDGAVASGNGIAVLNLLELAERTGEAAHRDRAEAALSTFAEGMSAAPLAHVTLVRALARQIASRVSAAGAAAVPAAAGLTGAPVLPDGDLEDQAREVVEVAGRLGSGGEGWRSFTVELNIRKGWHLNGNPAGGSLVATSMGPVLGRLRGLRYPPGVSFGPPAHAVPVYRGRVTLEGEIDHAGGGAPAVELTYQACDESRCLPPVTRLVRLQ